MYCQKSVNNGTRVAVIGMTATQKYHRGHSLITYANLDGEGWRRNRTNLSREGRLFVFTFHTHLLFLRNWDISTQLKSIATILNYLLCPKVYEMVGQGHERAAKYTSVEKSSRQTWEDTWSKSYPGSYSFLSNEIDSKDDEETDMNGRVQDPVDD